MDPNLFHIDWERTLEALVGVIVLSFLVERACAILFESRWWISRFEDARVGNSPPNGPPPNGAVQPPENPPDDAQPPVTPAATTTAPPRSLPGHRYPLKEVLSFLVALLVCWKWDFDAVSIILLSDQTWHIGIFITAAVIAGGSKASIALFHSLMKIRSSAEEERQALKAADKKAGGG